MLQSTTGRTIWGAVGVGTFGLDHDPLQVHLDRLSGKHTPKYTSTRSHSSPIVNELFEALQPCEVVRLGGSGHKVGVSYTNFRDLERLGCITICLNFVVRTRRL